MPFQPDLFRSLFRGGGARPTLFNVTMHFPAIVADPDASTKVSFLVKSTNLPGVTLGVAKVGFFGRDIKMAGDDDFQAWTCTVVNDEDFGVRNALIRWKSAIKGHASNSRSPLALNPLSYQTDIYINQYSQVDTGIPIHRVQLVGAFPTAISDIALDYEAKNTIETFTVSFEYQYWQSQATVTGDLVNDAISIAGSTFAALD